eukprot:6379189-Amphidinium_carterae.2
MEPYADFSLLTPFGLKALGEEWPRRSASASGVGCHRGTALTNLPRCQDRQASPAWLLVSRYADGTCVVRPQALEVYSEKFHKLVSDNLECWFLCVAAEDRARAEQMPRTRRAADHDDSQSWDAVCLMTVAGTKKSPAQLLHAMAKENLHRGLTAQQSACRS